MITTKQGPLPTINRPTNYTPTTAAGTHFKLVPSVDHFPGLCENFISTNWEATLTDEFSDLSEVGDPVT